MEENILHNNVSENITWDTNHGENDNLRVGMDNTQSTRGGTFREYRNQENLNTSTYLIQPVESNYIEIPFTTNSNKLTIDKQNSAESQSRSQEENTKMSRREPEQLT